MIGLARRREEFIGYLDNHPREVERERDLEQSDDH